MPHSIRRAAGACALASMMPVALAAHVQGSTETAVGVYDAAYVSAGRTYASLDELAAAILSAHPASVLIVSCTPAASTAWLSAVPRFEAVPMHLDVSDGSAPACSGMQNPSSGRPGRSDSDAAAGEYWARRMP